jgi:hypothetical protein
LVHVPRELFPSISHEKVAFFHEKVAFFHEKVTRKLTNCTRIFFGKMPMFFGPPCRSSRKIFGKILSWSEKANEKDTAVICQRTP